MALFFPKGRRTCATRCRRSSKMPSRTLRHGCEPCSPSSGRNGTTRGRHHHVSEEIERISQEDQACQRLRQIPGVGPLVSTAMVAAMGNGAAFRNGRDFAAWLGLVPASIPPAVNPAVRHQQARQHLSATHVHSRSTGGAAASEVRYRRSGSLGASAGGTHSTQQSDRRHRQQASPHCLGGVVQRRRLSGYSGCAVAA